MSSADEHIWNQVEAVLDSGFKVGFVATGGGIEVCSWLLNHPGASRAVVEVQVPYHEKALEQYLETPGPHQAAAETARAMAVQAYWRGRGFVGGDEPYLGVACTAALATKRVRRGADRAHIALRTDGEYHFYKLHFAKDEADRLEQEDVLSRFILQAMGQTCGGVGRSDVWPAYLDIEASSAPVREPLEAVLNRRAEVIEVHSPEVMSAEVERRDRLLFPGSFNPLHEGHIALAEVAQARAGRPLCLEISAENVDKPPLAYAEVERRLGQVRGRFPIVVTRAPTFMEKARLFPGCTFVIGFDTAARLVQGKYYKGGAEGMAKALGEMADADCRFLVAGRLHKGEYRTLDEIELPPACAHIFEEISETEFRRDINSSQLRAGRDE